MLYSFQHKFLYTSAIPQFETLEIAGSTPNNAQSVLNLSAPKILQRPAPQPGAPLFGAARPERPSAPANPGEKRPAAPLRRPRPGDGESLSRPAAIWVDATINRASRCEFVSGRPAPSEPTG